MAHEGGVVRPTSNMTSIVAGEQSGQKSAELVHVFLMCHRLAGPATAAEILGNSADRGSLDPARDEFLPESLSEALEKAGYRVSWSRNPLDSKRLLEKVRPAIVILDPLVCSADGVEFELAARLQLPEDPVPLLVFVGDLAELAEIRKVPALFKDFLVKPVSPEELVHRIELLLQAKERHLSLKRHARTLEGQVIRDFKTGLYTERHFRHLLRQEFQRSERHHIPLSFLLIDIDDFKSINDDYEYSFGDFVLAQFAEVLRRSIRDIDHPARFGGDEFMVLLPNTTQAEAVQVAARIRRQVARQSYDNGSYHTNLSCSIGIDTYDGRGLSSPEDLRRRANMALKEAKKRGKNRIWLYSGPAAVPGTAAQGPAEEGRGGHAGHETESEHDARDPGAGSGDASGSMHDPGPRDSGETRFGGVESSSDESA